MSSNVKTKSIGDVEKWDKAIQDANKLLERVESRADQLRRTIRSLREFRDAGEPWAAEIQSLATQNSDSTRQLADLLSRRPTR